MVLFQNITYMHKITHVMYINLPTLPNKQCNPSGKARKLSLKLQNLAHFHAPSFQIMCISPLITGHLFGKTTILGSLYRGVPLDSFFIIFHIRVYVQELWICTKWILPDKLYSTLRLYRFCKHFPFRHRWFCPRKNPTYLHMESCRKHPWQTPLQHWTGSCERTHGSWFQR